MASPEQMKAWLDANQDKAGTPDYVTVTEAYNKQAQSAAATAPPADGQLLSPTSVAQSLRDKVSSTFAPASADPGGPLATAGRIATGAATGWPDLLTAIGNAGVRASKYLPEGLGTAGVRPEDNKEAPYLGSMVNQAVGVPQMKDPSLPRQLMEGAASALVGGGASGVRSVVAAAPTAAEAVLPAIGSITKNVTLPTVGSHVGGVAGGWVGEKLGDRETGTLIGSLVGGVGPGAVKAGYDSVRHSYYAEKAHPDAAVIADDARQEGFTPTAGMLGNDIIKSQEKKFAGEPGASNYTSNLRRGVREDIGNVIDRAAAARGSTNTQPTPGEIGYDTAQVARVGAENYRAEASRRQQDLMNRIGPRAGTDIQSVIDAMNRVSQSTDPLTAGPIEARVNALRSRLPRDEQGNITSTELPYEVVKDARSGMRVAGEGYGAVSGRHAGTIEDAMTGTMRSTAENQGVTPDAWDRTQQHYASTMGEGGPHETLSGISDVQDPMAAYNYLRQGEQAPGNIRTLQNTGISDVDRVLGDYIRMMANKTINTANSRGPVNWADRWQGMADGARDAIGADQRPSLDRSARLARAYDYPPNQMGTTRMLGGATNSGGNSVLGPAALGWMAEHVLPNSGAPVAAAAKWGLVPFINNLRARALQSPATLNALSGGAAPQGMSIGDLVAAMTAASSANQQQRGPVNGVPR